MGEILAYNFLSELQLCHEDLHQVLIRRFIFDGEKPLDSLYESLLRKESWQFNRMKITLKFA